MKKLTLFLTFLCFVNFMFAQYSLDILEDAYIQFDKADYKEAVKSFNRYFEHTTGSTEDYYFMAAALAQTGMKKKAVEYAEKASTGIESYGMMLADPLFKPIHDRISVFYEDIKEFYAFYNSSKKYQHKHETVLPKIDSLYKNLESRRISDFDLFEISNKFNKQKDTFNYLYYYKETALYAKLRSLFSIEFPLLILENKERYPMYWEKVFPEINEGMKCLESLERVMMKNDLDSFLYYSEEFIDIVPDKLINTNSFFWLAREFSKKGEYEKSGIYLMKTVNFGFVFHDRLFYEKDLFPFYASPEGQKTLNYLISEYYGDAILNADFIFESTSKEESKSKRMIYDYLKAKDFDSQIPNAFQIYKNGKKSLNIPFFRENSEIQKSDFESVISVNKDGQLSLVEPKEDANTLVLCKMTDDEHYADQAGDCYLYPSGNLIFIEQLRKGKIKLSKIPEIKAKYLNPLKKEAYKAALLMHIDSDDETIIFSYRQGIDSPVKTLQSLYIETEAKDLKDLTNFIYYTGRHTALFDRTIEILKDTSYYNSLELEDKLNFLKYIDQTREILPFNSIGEKSIFPLKFRWRGIKVADKQFVDLLFQYGEDMEKWWTDYKAENPYTVPEFIFSGEIQSKEIGWELTNFIIDEQTNVPLFYSNSYKKFECKDEKKMSDVNDVIENGLDDMIFESTEDKEKDKTTEKNNEKVDKNDEESDIIEEAVVEMFNSFESVEEEEEETFLTTGTAGKYSYVFTPRPHTSDEILILFPKADSASIESLHLIIKKLGLKPEEKIKTQYGYKHKYDWFYPVKAFNNIVLFWFDEHRLYCSKLSEIKDDSAENRILKSEDQKTDPDDNTKYTEAQKYIKFMKSKQDGNSLYVLFNSSVDIRPNFDYSYTDITYLLKLNNNSELVKEIRIPEEYNPDIKFGAITKYDFFINADKLYVIIWSTCCGDKTAYYQIFDLDLNPLSDLIKFSDNIGLEFSGMPNLTYANVGDDVYVVYQISEYNELFIKIQKIAERKEDNIELYVKKSRGPVQHGEMIYDGKSHLNYYYTDSYLGKNYFNQIKIDLKKIKKKK